jgi:uncharacterized protein YndB with AHSA1/START domain
VSILVAVGREEAFLIFTEEIDAWWRRGRAYRAAGTRPGRVHLEPRLGGCLFEEFETGSRTRRREIGRVTAWEPPARLVLDWRAANFAPGERTEVEVTFESSASGTLVSVTHRGWSAIRPDHPARHGLETGAFLRMLGLWWGDLMTAMRMHAARREP